jgi:hypothetical protein
MDRPKTRYAKSGAVHVAYQVLGNGPADLVYVQGAFTQLDVMWALSAFRRFCEQLASFTRLIWFDKRGMAGWWAPFRIRPPVWSAGGQQQGVVLAGGGVVGIRRLSLMRLPKGLATRWGGKIDVSERGLAGPAPPCQCMDALASRDRERGYRGTMRAAAHSHDPVLPGRRR